MVAAVGHCDETVQSTLPLQYTPALPSTARDCAELILQRKTGVKESNAHKVQAKSTQQPGG